MQKYNPTITVLMLTFGGHTDMIGEAVESFLRQVYVKCKLLIVNTHPDKLRLDRDYPNIEIQNIKDEFNDRVSLVKYCLSQVESDAFTILDDDDILMPWALATLAMQWNSYVDTEGPVRIGTDSYYVWYGDREENNVEKHKATIWWNSIFSRLSSNEIYYIYKNYKNARVTGSDTYLVHNSYFTKFEFESMPLYLWRRKYPGQPNTCFTHIGKTTREDEWINYWQNKKKAYSKPLPEFVIPHWDKDYADSIWKGVVCNEK